MKKGPITALLLGLLVGMVCGTVMTAFAQGPEPREDVIWARFALEPITLDGVLDEPAWALAETKVVEWAQDAGIPGSGWKVESGAFIPSDPTYATLKFLAYENQLYLGAVVQDTYVGGSLDFNRFDGFLMAIKDHLDPFAPKPPAEYFYAWWFPEDADPQPPGQDPAFVGRWAEWPPGSPRTPEQIEAWDAVTIVDGLSNDDTVLDTSYTVEMRFNLTSIGYDITQPGGDIVEWNISIYDCDGFWPFNPTVFTSNRVWWQSPWGNAAWFNEVRIHARPGVTVASGDVPDILPELVIPKLVSTPVIDGEIDDAVWADPNVYTFDIRYGDDELRQTYPAVGPHRAGQYQPEVNGGQAFVLDPADATVQVFFAGEILYMGFDVRDLVVQYHPDFNRWDGFLVNINEYAIRGPDQQLLGRRVGFQVNQDGSALAQDYLTTLVTNGDAQVAISLNTGTTVDTLGMNADNGYTAELAIDLTGLGYPSGLGDGRLFLGVNHLDGDSFIPTTDSYGNRTWWFREFEAECCPVWAYLAPAPVGVERLAGARDDVLVRSFPNPFNAKTTVRFGLPSPEMATVTVWDMHGRLVETLSTGRYLPGHYSEVW